MQDLYPLQKGKKIRKQKRVWGQSKYYHAFSDASDCMFGNEMVSQCGNRVYSTNRVQIDLSLHSFHRHNSYYSNMWGEHGISQIYQFYMGLSMSK